MVFIFKMRRTLLLLATACLAVVATEDSTLPPTCDRPVYCQSDLLHYVQTKEVFKSDSKTFVDLQMRYDENKTLSDFKKLLEETNADPTKEQLVEFVDEYFTSTGELESWTLPDYNENPKFLNTIRDDELRQFGKDVNAIWPTLAMKVKPIVLEEPDKFSFIPLPHGFVVPGGRFKEVYYWDSFWTMEGLLTCEMYETAKGMIQNLIELLNKLGHIPNGSRWYYQRRSQPPLLSAMMSIYFKATNDLDFIRESLPALEKELDYWLEKHVITFEKDNQKYTLLRFYAPSQGPRPESYREDYKNAQIFKTKEEQQRFYTDIKSAAESGWDFSSRWFISKNGDNSGNLTNIHTRFIIPVDLNAIFAGALQNVANLHLSVGNHRKSAHYAYVARQWRQTIQDVLWDDEEGIWFDYDLKDNKHRKYFYTSNIAPLWQHAVEDEYIEENGHRALKYLVRSKGLSFSGGIPVSLNQTGEQWDFPYVWPPEVSIVINALEAIGTEESRKLALEEAQGYVRTCLLGYKENKQMFEKYDANNPGKIGGGGEYLPQAGFGWTNGVAFEFLNKYGSVMTANDSIDTYAKEGNDELMEDALEKIKMGTSSNREA